MKVPAALAAALGMLCGVAGAPAQVQVLEMPAPGTVSVERLAAPAVPCASEDFTIARMAWPSASILAHIHAAILAAEFGCTVRLVSGDPEATISSMATTRQPAVAPELWVSRSADLWNGALRAQSARAAGPAFSDGPIEAWFVPSYVLENHPGMTAAGLVDYWQVFAADGARRASLISCPTDWACAEITAKMVAAYGLDARFEIVEPLDRFSLDRMMTDAVAQRLPVIGYYWQPNALIDRLGLIALDMGPVDIGNTQCMAIANCVPFGPSTYAPDTVVIAVAEWVFTDAPQVAAYFQRAAMPLSEMNRLLNWQASQDADAEAVAAYFIATRGAVWRTWLGPEAGAVPAVDD